MGLLARKRRRRLMAIRHSVCVAPAATVATLVAWTSPAGTKKAGIPCSSEDSSLICTSLDVVLVEVGGIEPPSEGAYGSSQPFAGIRKTP
jgi:hypothetical protein